MIPRILATDLDGTLIPHADEPEQHADLERLGRLLHEHDVTLVYVTGRHLASVEDVRQALDLPPPDWMICDVGTSLYECPHSELPRSVPEYGTHLADITRGMPWNELRELLKSVPGIHLQEAEKQGPFKQSYYARAQELKQLVPRIQELLDLASAPYSLIPSVDPFNGDGLLDLLPHAVSKSSALAWWTSFTGADPDEIVYAGDSGNDLAPLTAGYHSILVGNAHPELAEQVRLAHEKAEWSDRLIVAIGEGSSGVLEGCHAFGLFDAAKS